MTQVKNTFDFTNSVCLFDGITDDTVSFLIDKHFSDTLLWKRFVNEFRLRRDGEKSAWRGEFWGKMIRGAVLVYEYRPSEEFYNLLTDTVNDMLTVVGEDGRVSTYTVDTEFRAWDMWCRKYVMLGLEYYLGICRDESLRERIIAFLRVVADYVIAHVGREEEGKIRIVNTSKTWHGINSSSILEPMVRLYNLTDDKKYLDFAAYIVEEGAAKGINVFELAYKNELYPYQYGANKAYELISCFEGLVEYYKVTGVEKYKTAAINFGKGLLASDYTVIGTAGITHELLDHSTTRQTTKYGDVSQETCVTVTMMKFFSLLNRLTGDSCFADAVEKSYYNAYLGAVNTEDKICPYGVQKFGDECKDVVLPFDSYSPLIAGKRGVKIGGGQRLEDNTYYGCCACIAGAGIGIYAKSALLACDSGLVLNFLEKGAYKTSFDGCELIVDVRGAYPADGKIDIEITSNEEKRFEFKVRIPDWAKDYKIGTKCEYRVSGGYAVFECDTAWDCEISLELDMPVVATYPIEWEEDVYIYASYMNGESVNNYVSVRQLPEERDYVSLSRGPLTLAADSRLGKPADSVFELDITDSKVNASTVIDPDLKCIYMCSVKDKNGQPVKLIDYASAGHDWSSTIAAWLKTK